MGPQLLPELSVLSVACGSAGLVAAMIVITKLSRGPDPDLGAFPSVGSNSLLGSWWAGFKYVTNARSVVEEGYTLHKTAPFKVAQANNWTVILGNPQHLEEVAKASEDVFSFLDAVNDQMQIEAVLGSEIHRNPYHLAVIRNHLTRNLEVLYPDLVDEIVTSFTEILDLTGHEWKSMQVLSVVQKIVCRTSNRIFVGLPLCHNSDWIDLNLQFTIDLVAGGATVGLFPKFMRSLATRLLTKVPGSIARGVKLLGPIIDDRRRYMNEYGAEWEEKPDDLLTWLMEEAKGAELTTQRLTTRLLLVNFASIHTSSNLFTQVLFYLAANPQYVQALRDEVGGVVEKDGWSKAALSKMRKIDSFLRECQRIEGISILALFRKASKDFTFSDGTFIPKGTSVAAPILSVHHDNVHYDNPDVFEPFRFTYISQEGDKGPKHQFASTSSVYLPFGHGRFSCPGRFFAASELKLMLAHIVMTYDLKLEDDSTYPSSWHVGSFIVANPLAKVMFRNRVR